MNPWVKVGENLVRHPAGKIYLQAKVGGKVIRKSLMTTDLRLAKLKRDDELAKMRKDAEKSPDEAVPTLGACLGTLNTRTVTQPHLSASTVRYYKEVFATLANTLPVTIHARLWTAADAAAWWKSASKDFSSQRANNLLGMVKRLGKLMVESEFRADDPTTKLRRVRIEAKELKIPSKETMDMLIASIRDQGKAHSAESAAYVGFLAYAGCRHGQAKAAVWEHVEGDWLTFPAGVSGTKGARVRRLPISGPLREVLDLRAGGESKPTGPIFEMVTPKEALRNACARLKIPAMRLHDLRHFFASHCLERGVDVPTVSRWLGHKDGGVLVLRTYGHLRDDHSLASVKKLG